jgi:hypothetical protein
MGAMPRSPHKPSPPRCHASRTLAATLALLTLGSLAPWAGLSAAVAAKPSSTPTFPVPASARPQSPSAGVTSGSATAATPGASTPTTTYAPSGAATAPAATTTTPPAIGVPATPGTTSAAPTVTTPAAKPAAAASPKASKGGRSLSAGAIVIAALAALLVLACAAWALARRSAFEPHWLQSLRHAMAEAGFRASATWSEFADWARLGR